MTPPGRIIAVEGASGVGKTTAARVAARSFGWVLLPEAFDRLGRRPKVGFQPHPVLRSTERALVREERCRMREAARLRREGITVVADTGFLGPLTYTGALVALGEAPSALLREVRGWTRPAGQARPWVLPDLVVYLDLPSPERRRRAARDAARHPLLQDRQHESAARVERSFYRYLAEHDLIGRVRFVRADRPPRKVAERIQALADALPVTTAARRTPSFAFLADRLGAVVRAASHRRGARVARHR